MNILEVFRNEYLHLLGLDHIAVDANGVPIARASDRASVERAAPNAAAYFSGADFAAAAGALAAADPAPGIVPGPVSVEPTDILPDPVGTDAPAIVATPEPPPQDNDHIEPGTELFPEAPAETETPVSEEDAPEAPVDPTTLN